MKKYNVKIISNSPKGSELLEYWELERERFTSRDYRNIITGLFYYGASSYRYSNLTAIVRCEEHDLFSIKNLTSQTFNGIMSHIMTANTGSVFTLQGVMPVAV